MKHLPHVLATTERVPRAAFGLAGLAAVAAFVWPGEPVPAPPPVAPRTESGGAVSGDALSRPLFDPGRRGWTARGDRASITEGDPPRPVLVLRGILLDGASARALIDDGSGDRTWLARGEGRGGWQVVAITPDRVTVSQNARLHTAEFMGRPATLRPAGARPVPDTREALRR